jgi:hypothetical protein
MRPLFFFFLGLLGALSVSCAPALSSFQPAHVAEKGHFQAEIGMDVAIPTGTIASVVEGGITLANAAENEELTQAERKVLFDAGTALALNPPSVVQHIGLAYTVLPNWELNLRYSVSAIRLGTRYQILKNKKHKVDLSVGAGVARYVLEFPVSSILDIVELDDYERWQFDFPIQIGKSGDWYRVWGGPRIMFTTFGTALTMNLPAFTGYGGEIELASFSGTGAYVGGQVGAALGYKYVFFAVELTLAQLFSGGSLDAFGQRGLNVDLDSFLVYPSFGLMGEF